MIFHTHRFESVPMPSDAFLFRRGVAHRIEADFRARAVWYHGQGEGRALLRALFHEGAMATIVLRLAEAWSHQRGTGLLARLAYWHVKVFGHMTVGFGASFGPGLVLIHPFGVYVHKTVVAGANLVLQNSLTLGGEDDRGPRIGDNVFVGVGARVIGPVQLGDRCRIGANAVVTVSVRPDHVAAGNPARQIPIASPENPAPTAATAKE